MTRAVQGLAVTPNLALIDGNRYDITRQELDREEYIALILAGQPVPAQFTLDVYGHVTNRMKQDSAARMEQFIHEVAL